MRQVVAVIDSTTRQARLAASLCTAFSSEGFDLQPRTQRELVAEVSIEQLAGEEPTVVPDRAMLWLSPGDARRPATPDDRFLASETYAAARSIALLTRSPVLNRPSAVSACGHLPAGRPLAVRRARLQDRGAAIRPERFTASWRVDDDAAARRLEVYDYGTGRSSVGCIRSWTGPFRHRPAVDSADLLKIRVIGDRTITAGEVSPAALAASRMIASGAGLDLATVWWLIGRTDRERTLARIEGWAFDAGFDDEVDEVAGAVAAWMGERLGRLGRVSG